MSRQQRRAYWHQQVTEWHATDLSAAAFCRQRALTYHQFLYWRQQFPGQPAPAADEAPGFARVTQAQPSMGSELSVTLPGGVRIAGLHAGNVHLLGSILGQL